MTYFREGINELKVEPVSVYDVVDVGDDDEDDDR